MKNIIFISLLCLVSFALQAQECSTYFNFTKGAKAELTSYDSKNKVVAQMKYYIKDFKPANGGFVLVIDTETYDAKGNLLAKGESYGKCKNGGYSTEIRNISSAMIPKSADIKMNIEGDELVYPSAMKMGDVLPNAAFKISAALSSGMTIMNATGEITNRKVEGMVTVDTPAGKFECQKITYDLALKLLGNRRYKTEEYLAKGIGVVKQIQYNDKGKIESSLVLTNLQK